MRLTWIRPDQIEIGLVVRWEIIGTSPVQIEHARPLLQWTVDALDGKRQPSIHSVLPPSRILR